jgi:hypothetical protein
MHRCSDSFSSYVTELELLHNRSTYIDFRRSGFSKGVCGHTYVTCKF